MPKRLLRRQYTLNPRSFDTFIGWLKTSDERTYEIYTEYDYA